MTTEQERQENYAADVVAMLRAARDWKAANASQLTELKFNPFPVARGGVMIGGLTASIIECVAGNPITYELLRALDAAAFRGGGATVMQAQSVIAEVFGIERAVFAPIPDARRPYQAPAIVSTVVLDDEALRAALAEHATGEREP